MVIAGIASNQDKFLQCFDKVILLRCDPVIFIERLRARKTNEFGKNQKAQENILSWYKDFQNDLISHGATIINTSRPISKITDEILKIVTE